MPNEMKPNQSFSPINQGPEAKPLSSEIFLQVCIGQKIRKIISALQELSCILQQGVPTAMGVCLCPI